MERMFDHVGLVDQLSLIQSTLHETDAINQATNQSLSRITQSILRLDDELSRVSCMSLRLHQVNEWMREKGAVTVSDGATLSAALKQSNSVANERHIDVFDAFKKPIVGNKPFAYHIERAYHALVQLCQRESSLIGAALALCESDGSIQAIDKSIKQPIYESDDNIHRSDAPVTYQVIHRRHIKQLCKCISRDLLVDELEAALCLTKALDHMYQHLMKRQLNDQSNRHSHVSLTHHHDQQHPISSSNDDISQSTLLTSSSIVPRLIVHTDLPHSHTAPMSSPISQPFHQSIKPINQSVLDHGSVPIKLLFEYNLQHGTSYLNNILVGCLNSVLNNDETMSLDIDLMGPSPTHSQSSLQRSPVSNGQFSGAQSSEDRLFTVCDQLLTAIVSSVNQLPLGIRLICRKLFELSCNQPIHEIINKQIDQADASAVMSDPSSPFRVCSDYLFLNWIINAIIHPEHYGLMTDQAFNHSAQPSIHCPSISQSQRRSLQAVSTVMIKLMSGSTFVFDSGRLVILNDFLDHWRGPIVNFILEVVDVKERSKPLTVGSLHHKFAEGSSGTRIPSPVMQPDAPAVMLPNDLTSLHGVLRHWHNASRTSSTSLEHTLHSSRDHVIPSSVVDELTGILDQLGDVPEFVGFEENMYIVLSTGFSDMNIDVSISQAISRLVEDPQSKSLGELLCDCLRSLPPIYSSNHDAGESSDQSGERTEADDEIIDVLDCLKLAAIRCELDGQTGPALIAEECASKLSQLSDTDSVFAVRQFLRALTTAVTDYWIDVMGSGLASSIVVVESHLQSRFDELKHREAVVMRSLHSLQIRRVVDLVNLKLRRLKRFMGSRSEKERVRQPVVARSMIKPSPSSPSPSVGSLEPAFMARFSVSTNSCSQVWPDSISDDRLLCSTCQKALDKKRTLLRSFYSKYLIGEETVSTASVPLIKSSVAPTAQPINRSSNAASSNAAVTPAVSVPVTIGHEPGEGHALLDLGFGSHLDLNDPVVYTDLMDAVVSSVWTEVRADCPRADLCFFVSNNALLHACGSRFDVLNAVFSLNAQHLSMISVQQIIEALAGGLTDHDAINIRLRALKSPRISELSLIRASNILRKLPTSYSCRDSLSMLNAVRGILTASLSHPALVSGGEVGSVDDYMCLLAFVLLQCNPFGLISHLTTMHALQPTPCNESKSFVDITTAVKALLELHGSCNLVPSEDCIERAKRRNRTQNDKPFSLSFSTSFTGSSSSREMRSVSPING